MVMLGSSIRLREFVFSNYRQSWGCAREPCLDPGLRVALKPAQTGGKSAAKVLPPESMSLIDSPWRGTPPDRWMPLTIFLRKRSLSARLIWRDFTRKWTRELSADETLSFTDSSLAGKAPQPAAGRPPSRAFTKKHTRGLSADEDIMYTDHSLGGKIANRSLSTGEIFSSGDSFVFYFFYHSERATCEVSPSRHGFMTTCQRNR